MGVAPPERPAGSAPVSGAFPDQSRERAADPCLSGAGGAADRLRLRGPVRSEAQCETGGAIITRSDFRWSRCDIKAISLAANCLANQEAQAAGAFEAVFVRDGMVLEGSHTNFFAVQNGVVRTAPLGNYILAGISRGVAIECCREAGIPVLEEALPESALAAVDEIFLTGSTTEVMPIVAVDGRPVGTGTIGGQTRTIAELYRRAAEAA